MFLRVLYIISISLRFGSHVCLSFSPVKGLWRRIDSIRVVKAQRNSVNIGPMMAEVNPPKRHHKPFTGEKEKRTRYFNRENMKTLYLHLYTYI